MANGTHRRRSPSAHRIRDPPGCTSSELCWVERQSSGGSPRDPYRIGFTGVTPSAAKTKREQRHHRRRADSYATLSTSACTTDESSLSGAEEYKDCSGDDSPIAYISTANEYGPHVVENEDECDTAVDENEEICWASHNAVNGDAVSFSFTKKQRCDPRSDPQMQENVRQTVEQILLEQTIAMGAWNEVAVEYHHRTEPFTSSFVPHLLDSKYLVSSLEKKCHYLKGMSVLDVAAGTGAGALYAASRGASSVTATDFSENMLQVLQSRIDAGNIHQMETRLANGLCLPLRWTNRYDVVLSNFGVIYFPKVQEGLSEMVRCAKPGGKVCISGWGSKEETPAFSIFPAAIQRCGLDKKWIAAQKGARRQLLTSVGKRRRRKRQGSGLAPNYFCPSARISSSGGSLRFLLASAGLDAVRVVRVEKELRVDDVESYWDRFVLASPNLKRFVEHCLGPGEVGQLREAVSELLHNESPNPQQGDGDGVVLKASAYVAIGTKTQATP